MPKPDTKLQRLRDLWAAGDYDKALGLAASWPRLGADKVAIQRGHAARTNPGLYQEMGHNVAQLRIDALAAIAQRYNLPAPIVRPDNATD